MYRLINKHAPAVVAAIDSIGDLSAYVRLRSSFLAGVDIASDHEFQSAYRSYWRMNNARQSKRFYSHYFALLGECRNSGSADVARIIQQLSEPDCESRGLQFSFATKLAHMVDPRLPVYDSFVASFYFYVRPSSKSPAERIRNLLSFYDFLRDEYERILRQGLLTASIREFRTTRTIDDAIPDERIIDWLLWAWVSFLNKGAQRRGDALFD